MSLARNGKHSVFSGMGLVLRLGLFALGIGGALLPIVPMSAMDVPSGLGAFTAGPPDSGCGGSLVVISADGLALTLAEALPPDAKAGTSFEVALSGGHRRQADVIARGQSSSAVLLSIHQLPESCIPLQLADSRGLSVGAETWTVGNASGAIALDGQPALSCGIISGMYVLPADAPPVRGRGGRVLSGYHGAVIETDAAVNDGSQGGALLDAAGHCIALVSLGQARERRLGTAVPIDVVLADLSASLPAIRLLPPAALSGDEAAFAHAAQEISASIAAVYFERPEGLGNPADAMQRPPRLASEVPPSERDRFQRWWAMYYQQQQLFYTDQPVCALVLDPAAGLMVTAAGNLHGGATHGRVLLDNGSSISCTVVAKHVPFDLAILHAESALPFSACHFAVISPDGMEVGTPIAVVGALRPSSGGAPFTLARGVVSAAHRHLAQHMQTWLQVDARTDYGSLGAPVIDSAGRVLGLAALLAPEEYPWLLNSGVAMAMDINSVLRVLPELEQGISTEKLPTLGLGIAFSQKGEGKLLVAHIMPKTGAESAGIKPGDVVERIDGVSATSLPAVSRVLLKHAVGDVVPVELIRDGKALTLRVEISEFR